jgi:hypothetical protein
MKGLPPRWLPVFLRLAGIVLVVAGLIWLLLSFGVNGRSVGAWLLFAFGFLMFGEAASGSSSKIWSEDQRNFEQGDDEKVAYSLARSEAEQHQNDTRRGLIEVAFLVLSVLGLLLVVHGTPPFPGQQNQTTVRFSDQVESALVNFLQRPPQGGGGPNGGTVQLDPEQMKALLEALKRPPNAFPWEMVVLIVSGALLMWYVIKEHPSAAPVVGAAELALAAIKYADHLSKLDPWTFRAVVAAFVIAAVLILGWGLRRLRFGPESATDVDPETGEKKIDSALTTAFSLLVLTWAIVLVTYRPAAESVKPPPPAPGESKSESKVTWIEPIPHFATGVKDSYSLQAGGTVESSADALKRIFSNAGPVKGDILLLVGSADCTSYRSGTSVGENKHETNTVLATERADKIEGELKEDAQKYGVEIRKKPLPQYNRCAEAGDLRAVFPFLIHPGSATP